MRLLNATSLELEEFPPNNIPPYAILSHTWEADEITFQDIKGHIAITKAGYAKLRDSCKQTLRDNLAYIWVDTCCIDKTSSTELSEAINSMFRWYKEANVCYAFLADVPSDTGLTADSDFARSKWFTRGWTLQELLAPSHLKFYSQDWSHLGSKAALGSIIRQISGIDEGTLQGRRPLSLSSIAARLSWASRRITTREEDRSYSLLGLFGVQLPLLYGEGERNAFLRLQEELIRISDDRSIFAWEASPDSNCGLSFLASSPDDFSNCTDIALCNPTKWTSPFSMTNGGIKIDIPIIFEYDRISETREAYAILWCCRKQEYWKILAVPVILGGDRCVRSKPVLRSFDRKFALSCSFDHNLYLEARQNNLSMTAKSLLQDYESSAFVLRSLPPGYQIDSVQPPEDWEPWSPTSGRTRQVTRDNQPHSRITITITANGTRDLPFRNLHVVVNSRLGPVTMLPKHVIAIAGTNGHDGPRPEFNNITLWEIFSSYTHQVLRLRDCSFYCYIRPESGFRREMHTVDLIMDQSSLRDLKATVALFRNWTSHLNQSSIFRPIVVILAALLVSAVAQFLPHFDSISHYPRLSYGSLFMLALVMSLAGSLRTFEVGSFGVLILLLAEAFVITLVLAVASNSFAVFVTIWLGAVLSLFLLPVLEICGYLAHPWAFPLFKMSFLFERFILRHFSAASSDNMYDPTYDGED